MIKHVEIVNSWGRVLRGYLDLPNNFNGDIIVMFHGYTGNKTEHAKHFLNFSRLVSKDGYATLRMDFSGNGESDGEFSDFTMTTMTSEAKDIVNYAKQISGVKKVTLLGFSMGGAVATYLSREFGNEISKIILWSPAANITEIIQKQFENSPKLENGNAQAGTFEVSKSMIDSLKKFDPINGISVFTNPVLIVHGRQDKAVDYLYSVRYSVLYYNSRLHIVATSGHGYDQIAEKDELYKVTRDFLLENK